MELKELIKDYLHQAKLMQLATSLDHQPWVCTVWFASDEKLNIYWFSSVTRRHSQDIMKNQKVAAAMVLPHTTQQVPRGLQLQGVADLLIDKKDVDKAVSVYAGRIFSKEKIRELMESKEKPHYFYRIKPTQFVLYDGVNFPDNSRQEYDL